jgi:uncharacterized protein (TIGR02594 family)
MNCNPEFTHHYRKDLTPEQKDAEERIVQSTYKVIAEELDKQEEIRCANSRARMLIFSITAATVIILVLAAWWSVAHADVVSIARQEIGHGELLFDNFGPDVARYMQGRQGQPWCAGFVSYVLQKAGYQLPYTLRARNFLKYGKSVSKPAPGDLAVFSRGSGGHVGIVEYCSDNKIIVIEGNAGKAPVQVRRVEYKGIPGNLLGWVRITKGR